MEEINIDIVKRKEKYPPKFYQVLEKIDLVMRNWVGDKMGTDGVQELHILCGIFAIDWWLEYNMPSSARAWFVELVNPKNAWKYHDKSGNVFGSQLKAYADLRQYLIDNAERVTKAYNTLMNTRLDLKEENNNE